MSFKWTSQPLKLQAEDVRIASLKESDIGSWRVIVSGCYHLFSNEKQARMAYEKFSKGVLVR